MEKKAEPVRFALEASHIPGWDAKHPLFKQFGSATWEVETAHGAARVEIPAVEDAKVAEIIIALAARKSPAEIDDGKNVIPACEPISQS